MMRYRLKQWLGLAPRSMVFGDNPALQAIARTVVSGQTPEGWRLLCSSAQTRVAKGTWEGREVYLKVFLPRSAFEELKALGRGSRGTRSVDRSALMNSMGFRTPPILAYGRGESRLEFVLTEAVSHPTLDELLTRNDSGSMLPLVMRRQLLWDFGHEVARLHRAGWVHGDLRLGNVLCDRSNGLRHPEFWYLDNEGSRRSFNSRQQRRNLVQLVMTPRTLQSWTDQLRIVRSYAEGMILDRNRYQKLVRRVVAERNRRWKRRLSSGGPKRRYLSDGRKQVP